MTPLGKSQSIDLYSPISSLSRKDRETLHGHKACAIWMTGLSGSGKSTLANALQMHLHAQGQRTYVLDGDSIRRGLNRDLGFSEEDRAENIRRVSEVARLFVDAGTIVIAALISPFRVERDAARALFEPGDFIEVFVDVPLAVAERRDPKGLYRKARNGQLPLFTGIDSPYEVPLAPELTLRTDQLTVPDCMARIHALLQHGPAAGTACSRDIKPQAGTAAPLSGAMQ